MPTRLPPQELRAAALQAVAQLLRPLAGFVIDAGLSGGELRSLLREALVKSMSERQLEFSRRVNISGIAATTGIPRAEITRILKQKQNGRLPDRRQQSTNRILAAWHDEPRFTNARGKPSILRLYGAGATFDALVKSYGGGLPTRAVLEELMRTHVVDLLPAQRIRAKACLAAQWGLRPHVLKAFGDHASDLLSTMLWNLRNPESQMLLATITAPASAPKLRKTLQEEVSKRSAKFLARIQQSFPVGPHKRGTGVVGLTVFYHEAIRRRSSNNPSKSRTNFRRKSIG